MTTKKEAAALLRKYDKLRHEMRELEHNLAKACADYGRSIGVWGFTRDHLRMQGIAPHFECEGEVRDTSTRIGCGDDRREGDERPRRNARNHTGFRPDRETRRQPRRAELKDVAIGIAEQRRKTQGHLLPRDGALLPDSGSHRRIIDIPHGVAVGTGHRLARPEQVDKAGDHADRLAHLCLGEQQRTPRGAGNVRAVLTPLVADPAQPVDIAKIVRDGQRLALHRIATARDHPDRRWVDGAWVKVANGRSIEEHARRWVTEIGRAHV